MAALVEDDAPGAARPRKRSGLDTLTGRLVHIVERFSTGTGRHIATLLAAAAQDSELSR